MIKYKIFKLNKYNNKVNIKIKKYNKKLLMKMRMRMEIKIQIVMVMKRKIISNKLLIKLINRLNKIQKKCHNLQNNKTYKIISSSHKPKTSLKNNKLKMIKTNNKINLNRVIRIPKQNQKHNKIKNNTKKFYIYSKVIIVTL